MPRARISSRRPTPVSSALLVPIEAEAPVPRANCGRSLGCGVAALAMLLVAQVVNHYRDELAVNPRLHRPLTALYAAARHTAGAALGPCAL